MRLTSAWCAGAQPEAVARVASHAGPPRAAAFEQDATEIFRRLGVVRTPTVPLPAAEPAAYASVMLASR